MLQFEKVASSPDTRPPAAAAAPFTLGVHANLRDRGFWASSSLATGALGLGATAHLNHLLIILQLAARLAELSRPALRKWKPAPG